MAINYHFLILCCRGLVSGLPFQTSLSVNKLNRLWNQHGRDFNFSFRKIRSSYHWTTWQTSRSSCFWPVFCFIGPQYLVKFQPGRVQSCHQEKISWYLVSICCVWSFFWAVFSFLLLTLRGVQLKHLRCSELNHCICNSRHNMTWLKSNGFVMFSWVESSLNKYSLIVKKQKWAKIIFDTVISANETMVCIKIFTLEVFISTPIKYFVLKCMGGRRVTTQMENANCNWAYLLFQYSYWIWYNG